MHNGTANRIIIGTTAQNLLRIVIASYFIAVSLQLIPGTNLSVLFAEIAPPPLAELFAKWTVFVLAFFVMIGIWMRVAALILGTLTFFASCLTILTLGPEQELGNFWRDLALIAALVLTYSETAPRDHRMRQMIRRRVTPRRVHVAYQQPAPQFTQVALPLASPVATTVVVDRLQVVEGMPDPDSISSKDEVSLAS